LQVLSERILRFALCENYEIVPNKLKINMTNKSSGKQRIAQTEGYKEQGMNVKQQDTHTFPKVEYDLMTQF